MFQSGPVINSESNSAMCHSVHKIEITIKLHPCRLRHCFWSPKLSHNPAVAVVTTLDAASFDHWRLLTSSSPSKKDVTNDVTDDVTNDMCWLSACKAVWTHNSGCWSCWCWIRQSLINSNRLHFLSANLPTSILHLQFHSSILLKRLNTVWTKKTV